MQTSVNPGCRIPLPTALLRASKFLSALLLLLCITGIRNSVQAQAGVPDPTNPGTVLVITQDSSIADGNAMNVVEAHVVDQFGDPVAGATVYFRQPPGSVNYTRVTNSAGVAEFTFTSTDVGAVTIAARVGTTPFQNTATVHFIAYIPDGPQSSLIIVDDSAINDDATTNTVRAIVRDVNGNPVKNQLVTFTITAGAGTFTATGTTTYSGITAGDGSINADLVSSVENGVTVLATINAGPDIDINPTQTVQFIANTPYIPRSSLQIVTNGALANGMANNTVKVVILDAGGNPVPNATIVFGFYDNSIGAYFNSSVTDVTDGNGEFAVNIASFAIGHADIVATVNGDTLTNGSPARVTFVSDVPDFYQSMVIVDKDNSIANNVDTNIIRAHVVDATGNPVAAQQVIFRITSGTASPDSLKIFTDSLGDAVYKITSTVAGSVIVSVTVNDSAMMNNNPATVTFVADTASVSAPTTRLIVVDTFAVADNIGMTSVKVIVTDAYGNVLSGQTVTFNIASGVATFTPGNTVITDVNGEATISLISTVAGPVDLTAVVIGKTIINGSPARMYFVAGPPDINHALTALIIDKDSSVANALDSNSIRAHIVDQYGNPVPGQTIDFAITTGSGAPTVLTALTDALGNAVFKVASSVIGAVTVSGKLNGADLINNNPVTVQFVAGVPNVIVPTTLLIVVDTMAVADSVDIALVKAVITDINGNLVPGATVVFKIAAGQAAFATSDTVITNGVGEAFISLISTRSGPVNITATVNGMDITHGSPAQVIFVAGAPDFSNPATALHIDADSADADGIAVNIIRAHIVDKFGNPVINQDVDFSYTGSITGGPVTIATDSTGNAVFSLSSTTVGTSDITASVNGTDIINNSPATVTFTAYPDVSNPQTQLYVVTDNAFADGTATNSVGAHLIDNQGNPMAGAQVTFTITSGTATIVTPQPVLTDANGNAVIVLTSNTPGFVTVTAVADGRPIVFGSPARVRFTQEEVWVPSVFTPNGDGTNDFIRPVLNGITMQYFNVFNRWGNLLFTTNNPAPGWDGRFKGVMQPNETYIWVLVGNNSSNQRVQKRGMFSLVK